MANITGWGRGTWSEGAWNEALPVEPTGLSATGNVDAVMDGNMHDFLKAFLMTQGQKSKRLKESP